MICDRGCGFVGPKAYFLKVRWGLQCPRCRHLQVKQVQLQPDSRLTPLNYPQGVINLGATIMAGTTAPNPDDYLPASFLGLVTFDDVGNEKRSIAPYVEQTQIKELLYEKNLPPILVSNWKAFYAEWKDFYSSTTFVPPTAYKKALDFRFRLAALQQEMNPYFPANDRLAYVPLPVPTAPGAATPGGDAGGPAPTKPDMWSVLDSWSTTAKIGLVVGGVALGLVIYYQAKNSLAITREFLPQVLPLAR